MSAITDQIRERIDIVDLIREYVPELKKAGVSWKARCPFHQEKTPSFIVSPEKGIWHCFGCHEGGDVFAFIKKAEGLEFPDALRLLAKRAGVKLEAQNRDQESERSRILTILNLAAQWYHAALLKSKSGEQARKYLAERGVSDKTIGEWQLGFAPDAWDELLKYLQSRGYREQEIIKTGLLSESGRGSHYDRFRYRLIFPITDAHGAVVGFTARKLRDEDLGGKYINTPETAAYHKGQVLYGLSKAKQEIRKQDLAVVVEGNMDCISSHQVGICNVVAASGTALTPEQVKLLKRFTKNICLAFAPDPAGQAALVRGLEVAWQEDMIIQMAQLPTGLDPDALIKKNPEDWRHLIASQQNFMDWLFAKAIKENDLTGAIGKKQVGKTLLPWLARLPDAIEQNHYLQLLSSKLNVHESVLRQVLSQRNSRGKRVGSKQKETSAPASIKRDVADRVATRLLALALRLPDMAGVLAELGEEWLPNDDLIHLYKSLNFFYDTATVNRAAWLEGLPLELHSRAREVLLLADELSGSSHEDVKKEIAILRQRLKAGYIAKQLQAVRANLQSAEVMGDVAAVERELGEWKRLSEEMKQEE